jgi:hypothetical protein
MPRRTLPTVIGLTSWPCFANSAARFRKLRLHHNSGCIRSPRVTDASIACRSASLGDEIEVEGTDARRRSADVGNRHRDVTQGGAAAVASIAIGSSNHHDVYHSTRRERQAAFQETRRKASSHTLVLIAVNQRVTSRRSEAPCRCGGSNTRCRRRIRTAAR